MWKWLLIGGLVLAVLILAGLKWLSVLLSKVS